MRPVAARRIGPLLTAAVSWGVRLPVAELLLCKARRRTALSARRPVVTAMVRAIAARGVRALFAFAPGTVIPVEARRAIGERPVAARTRSIRVIPARGTVTLAGVRLAGIRIRLL